MIATKEAQPVRSSFPLRWEVKVGERQISELWGMSPAGSVMQMYRYRAEQVGSARRLW